MAAVPKFESLQDELLWYKQKYNECQLELDEFQVSSKELEMELETQLTQVEKENRNLKSLNQKLESERDIYAEKLTLVTTELRSQLEQLDEDLKKERNYNDELQRHVRGLEQNNDDLERAKRTLAASLEEFDARLNHAIERNAFLESELDEKEQLSAMVQRLKEETRDLKQELHVRKRLPNGSTSSSPPPSPASMTASMSASMSVSPSPSTGGGRLLVGGSCCGDAGVTEGGGKAGTAQKQPAASGEKKKSLGSSHSGVANALDLVNDLLRKVGTLMNVSLTPPPTRRRSNSKNLFEANNNGDIREEASATSDHHQHQHQQQHQNHHHHHRHKQ